MSNLADVGRDVDMYCVGDLAMSRSRHRVTVAGSSVNLTRSEFLLLETLMRRPDEMLSRSELSIAIWGEHLAADGRPVDQHIYRLRLKLQGAAASAQVPPPLIEPVTGFGYRLVATTTPVPLMPHSATPPGETGA